MIYSPPAFQPVWADYLRADGSYDLSAAYADIYSPDHWHAHKYLKSVEAVTRLRDPGAASVALSTAYAFHLLKV